MSAWHQPGALLAYRPSVSFISTDGTWARPVAKVGGEVKLSISYKNNKLFIMVMHIRGLVSEGTALLWSLVFLLVGFGRVRTSLPLENESDHRSLLSLHHRLPTPGLRLTRRFRAQLLACCGLWQHPEHREPLFMILMAPSQGCYGDERVHGKLLPF